jgi:hypothetical protein
MTLREDSAYKNGAPLSLTLARKSVKRVVQAYLIR